MNLKKMLKVGVLLTLLFGVTQGFAWQMVYHHDANGNKIAGSLDTLKNAIENGHKVRVSYSNTYIDPVLVLIKNNIVYLQSANYVALSFNNDIASFYTPATNSYVNVDSNGNRIVMEVKADGSTSKVYAKQNLEMKWFID